MILLTTEAIGRCFKKIKMNCKRCNKRAAVCKEQCHTCYVASKNKRKIKEEIAAERNYINNSVGFLTNGRDKWEVDLADFEVLKNHLWYNNGDGYACSTINGKKTYLHRLLMKSDRVDHINGNRFDNKKSNLRDGSKINNFNQKLFCTNTSGYRGVSKMRNKWQARISRTYIGTFSTKEEAYSAVVVWAKDNQPVLYQCLVERHNKVF